MLLPGTTLGPYEILGPLGVGGMGEVYRARDRRLERDVAIKVLPEGLLEDDAAIERFRREGQALAALSHPSLLSVFDVGGERGTAYLVTELLEGKTLRDRLVHSALSWREAVRIATAITDGLAAAHSRGIVHRDLKPENVFLTDDGLVKILDFGIARRGAPASSDRAVSEETATGAPDAGVVLGTPGYMSPEQISGSPADARSDLFSLGAVLYEMLTERRAFPGASRIETLSAVLKDEPAAMSDPKHPIPAAVEAITRRCLEKSPSKRFESARDLAFALRSVAASGERAAASPRGARVRRALIAAAAVMALGVGVFGIVRSRSGSPRFDSLAVLPFANLGSDPSAEYLSEGVTDSLIDRLSRLPGLRVASRAAVVGFKDKPIGPIQAARSLNVSAVLNGSVKQVGDNLTIAVELVDARDGRHLWGERYVRKASEAPALEPEIAREIVDSLKFRISGPDAARLSDQYTQNPEAYQLYLKGRYFWNTWDLEQARVLFEKAIAQDPTYALAYAGLSDTYAKLGHTYAARPSDAFPKARAAALEALKIDGGLVEARVALAGVQQCYDGELARAERGLRDAIAMQPAYAVAHRRYALLLETQRRFDGAVTQIGRAAELEPFSAFNHVVASGILCNAGRLEEAMEECGKVGELEPNSVHGCLAGVLAGQGKFDLAIAEYRKASPEPASDPESLSDLGFAYGAAGRAADARATLQSLKDLAGSQYVGSVYPALVHAGLRENALALDCLEKAADNHEPIGFVNADKRFDALRTDPRFRAVLARLGLT